MVVAQNIPLTTQRFAAHKDSDWYKYLLSCVAATAAELATYPLDLAKTRLQIQGEQNANSKTNIPYRGLFRTGVGIVQEEGLLRLWQGMTPAIYRHFVYTGVRVVLYEKVRDHVFTKKEDGTNHLWQSVCGGMLIGGFAQFLASPADLVKVQLQMEGRRQLEGKPPRVRGPGQAFMKIYGAGGIRGLWKGCMPNVYRSGLVNLGDLTTYDSSKRYLISSWQFPDTTWTHALASFFSGFVSAVLGTPADVVKARVMNQPTDKAGRGLLYKNSLDCLRQTIRNEGFWAMYKGFLPCWIRMGPWSLTFWLTYEKIRSSSGTSGF